jgi:hypothetical protein
VYGGRLKRELIKNAQVRRLIALLDSVGRARQVSDSDVDTEEAALLQAEACLSDDPHVIALARVSDARVLCSEDVDLIADFRNKRLIDEPRGKIYSRPAHAHLLRQHCAGQ